MVGSDNIGYALHHLVFVLDRQSDTVLQERLGIGFSQFKILMVLQKHQNVQQRRIAEFLGQTEASVSRQIKLLEDKGYVEITVSASNRREHKIAPSTRGEQLAEQAMEVLNAYHAPVFANLSNKEQRVFLGLLAQMHGQACQQYRPGSCSK